MADNSTYLIEDDLHADSLGETYSTLEDALAEVHRIINLPFEQEPHTPPCTSWRQCQREIVIREVRTLPARPKWGRPRTSFVLIPILTTSVNGVVWAEEKYERMGVRASRRGIPPDGEWGGDT